MKLVRETAETTTATNGHLDNTNKYLRRQVAALQQDKKIKDKKATRLNVWAYVMGVLVAGVGEPVASGMHPRFVHTSICHSCHEVKKEPDHRVRETLRRYQWVSIELDYRATWRYPC